MTYSERDRLFSIKCRSKQGRYISRDDTKFCEKMLKLYPTEYKAMEVEVFESTKPFGSN